MCLVGRKRQIVPNAPAFSGSVFIMYFVDNLLKLRNGRESFLLNNSTIDCTDSL